MKHIYQDLNGWFTFPNLYAAMVKRFDTGSRFLEIGMYAGKSFSYIMVEIINSGKDIELIGIDGFGWDGLKEEFDTNMKPFENKYTIVKGNSIELSRKFPDAYLDFVFIDANHTYEDVKADILAYLPKVKPGGIIAGHDYCSDWPGVIQAVTEVFGERVCIHEDEFCWSVDI